MKLLMDKVSQRRDEWLQIKNQTVGSSEIGAICGLSNWQTPLELWARKTGKLEPQPENTAMWLGTKLQPVVGELFTRQTGMAIVEPDCMYTHPQVEWATATPDFFAFPDNSGKDQRVLEVKTTNARQAAAWEDNSAPTLAYMQTIWQLGVLGLERGHIAALIGGQEFKHVEVEFQSPLFEQMMAMADTFMKCVKSGTPPSAKPEDLKILDALRDLEDRTVHLPPECITDVQEWNRNQAEITRLKNELKILEKTAAKHRVNLEQLLGNASRGLIGAYEITLKKVERKSYCVEASSYTTFKVKEANGESDGTGLAA